MSDSENIVLGTTIQPGVKSAQLESETSPIPYNPISLSSDCKFQNACQPSQPSYCSVLQSAIKG